MKNIFYLRNALVPLLVALGLSSCESEDPCHSGNYSDTAFGIVINAAPNSGDLYFNADENAINSSGLSFTEAAGYYAFYTGKRTIHLKDHQGVVLDTLTTELIKGNHFSLFAANTLENIELLIYPDDFPDPRHDRSYIRFINLSPDAPGVEITGMGHEFTNDLAFSQATGFTEVTSGGHDLYYKDSATGELLYEETLEVLPGRIYTIYTKGFVSPPDGSNDTFSSALLRHN